MHRRAFFCDGGAAIAHAVCNAIKLSLTLQTSRRLYFVTEIQQRSLRLSARVPEKIIDSWKHLHALNILVLPAVLFGVGIKKKKSWTIYDGLLGGTRE